MVSKKQILKNKKNILIKVDNNINLKALSLQEIGQNYLNWINDYEVTRYTELRFKKSKKSDIKKFVMENWTSDNNILFGIFFKNYHLGNIKLGPINWEQLRSELSYIIGEIFFWGKGVGTKYVNSVVEFAFSVIGLQKINAGYYEINIASQKVLERTGFQKEGVRLSNVIVDGKRINSVEVGRLNEWFLHK
mgnify:CR=1 FL=1